MAYPCPEEGAISYKLATLQADLAVVLGFERFEAMPKDLSDQMEPLIRDSEREIYGLRPWPFLIRRQETSVSAYVAAQGAVAILHSAPGPTDISKEWGLLSMWWIGTVNRRVREIPFAIGAQKRLPRALGLTAEEHGPAQTFFLTYDGPTTQNAQASGQDWSAENPKIFLDPPLPSGSMASTADTMVFHYYRQPAMTGQVFDLPAKYHFALFAGAAAKAAERYMLPEDVSLREVWSSEWTRAKEAILAEAGELEYGLAAEAHQGRWGMR